MGLDKNLSGYLYALSLDIFPQYHVQVACCDEFGTYENGCLMFVLSIA